MPPRAFIKDYAKTALRDNYGLSVVVILVLGVIAFIATYTVLGALFITLPLSLGVLCFFVSSYRGGRPDFALMFTAGFGRDYLRKVGGMFLMAVYIFLWCLLFFIPGIIMSYAYAMTPYILAVYPDVRASDAIRLSKRIMRGNKADLFIFELSFIGWMLLSTLTCGLLAILYVGPYMQTALAGYFYELMEYSQRNGVVTPEELSGGPVMP